MMRTSVTSLALLPLALAQNVTVPTSCEGYFTAATNEVLYTIPYSYDQVLSIIGNYSNITWYGVPDMAKLNGTDNAVGTARTWSAMGLELIETILEIDVRPSPGPYYEVHNTALLTLPDPTSPSRNTSFYIPRDYTTVTSVCSGKAVQFNLTAEFCATNAPIVDGILGQTHGSWGPMVAMMLGGENYTSCEALGSDEIGPANATAAIEGGAGANGTATTGEGETGASGSAMPSATMGGAAVGRVSMAGSVLAMAAGVMML